MWKKGGVARWFSPTSANRFGKIRRKGGRCGSRRTSSHSCARYRGYGYQMMKCTLQFFAAQKRYKIPRPVDYPNNLDSRGEGDIEHEHLFKTRNSKHTQRCQPGGAGAEEADPSGVESRARRRSHEQPRESDVQSPGLLLLRGRMPAGRGLGLPSGEGGTERSLPARASKAFIELLMLGFPIPRAGLNWFAGVDSLGSQRGQFVLCTLFSPHKTLQVGFDGQPLGLGSGAQLSFQFGMNGDAHEC